jgi:hypothetical protein
MPALGLVLFTPRCNCLPVDHVFKCAVFGLTLRLNAKRRFSCNSKLA